MNKNKLITEQFGLKNIVFDYDNDFSFKTINNFINFTLSNYEKTNQFLTPLSITIKQNKNRSNFILDIKINEQTYSILLKRIRNYGQQNNCKRFSLSKSDYKFINDTIAKNKIPIFVALYHYYDKENNYNRFIPLQIPLSTVIKGKDKTNSSYKISSDLLFSLPNKKEKVKIVENKKDNKNKYIKSIYFVNLQTLLEIANNDFTNFSRQKNNYTGKTGNSIEVCMIKEFCFDKNNQKEKEYVEKWQNEDVEKSMEPIIKKIKTSLKTNNDYIEKYTGNNNNIDTKKRNTYDFLTKNKKQISVKSCSKLKGLFTPKNGDICADEFYNIFCKEFNYPRLITDDDMKDFLIDNPTHIIEILVKSAKKMADTTYFIDTNNKNKYKYLFLEHKDINFKKLDKEKIRIEVFKKPIKNKKDINTSCQIFYDNIQLLDFEIKLDKKSKTNHFKSLRFRFYINSFIKLFTNLDPIWT